MILSSSVLIVKNRSDSKNPKQLVSLPPPPPPPPLSLSWRHFTAIYKKLMGKDVTFEFPEPLV